MKVSLFLAMALVGGLIALPMQAASPKLEQAVVLAAPTSDASLDAICLAAYEAAKENPDQLDVVLESVLEQRTTWKADEVYAIMRAVLMARPDLMNNLSEQAAAYKGVSDGRNGKAVHEAAPELYPMVSRVLNVLHLATLDEGVAENALNLLLASITGVYEHAWSAAFYNIGINTNLVEGVIPTPAPVSPQN